MEELVRSLSKSIRLNREKALLYIDTGALFLLSLNLLFAEFNYFISWTSLVLLIPVIGLRMLIGNNVYYPPKTLIAFIAIFIVLQVVSAVYSTNFRDSFFVVKRRAMLYIPFLAAVMFIKNPSQLKKIFASFIVFTSLVSLYEVLRFFADPYFSSTPIYEMRVGYFAHPVTLGEIKMLVLVLITVLFFSKEVYVLSRKWLLILAVPIAVSFYLTNSRGALLGLFTALMVIGFIRSRMLVNILLTSVILFLLLAPATLQHRIDSITDWDNKGVQSRVMMWYTSMFIIHDYPVIGVGSADPIDIYKQYRNSSFMFDGEGHQMHNNVIHLLVTDGALGLAAWLAVMIFIFYKQIKTFRQTKHKPELNNLALIGIGTMLAFQISGLTDWNFGDFAFSFVLWTFLSFSFLAEKFNENFV